MRTLIILLLFAANLSLAQNLSYQSGARSAALAHASVGLSDVWAAHHNQAGLAYLEHTTAAVFVSQRYFLKDLNHAALAFATPAGEGRLGMALNYFGFELYNETKLGLNYARQFGSRLSFGLQLNYHRYFVQEANGNRSALTAEAGVMAKPMEKLTLGLHIFNPTRSSLSNENNEQLPLIGRLGARYAFSDRVSLLAELRKNQLYEPRYALGFEYEFVENMIFRTGINTEPIQNSFGLGYRIKNLEANLSFEYARILGSSGGIGLQYQF